MDERYAVRPNRLAIGSPGDGSSRQRTDRGDPGGTRSLWLAIAPIYIVTFIFLVAPNSQRFPTVLLSTLTFSTMQVVFPACRPIRATPLCPLNWVTAAFAVQLVVLPLYINFAGPAAGTLPHLPADESINWAILLGALAYASFCATYQALSQKARSRDRTTRVRRAGARSGWSPDLRLIALYAGLGLIGIYFRYGGLSDLVAYFTQPNAADLIPSDESASLIGAASSFLMPFLGFALVMLWCRWIDRRQGPRLPRLIVAPAMLIFIIGSYYTFNYNRGAMVAPVIALATVYSTRVRRISTFAIFAAGAAGFLVLMALGAYRTSNIGLADLLTDPSARQALGRQLNLDETFQVYGGAPQFTAFALESSDYARHLYWGATLGASVLLPVPIIGKPFRPYSGVTIYNQMIYGNITTLEGDQIVPFAAELFFNFHLFGVAIGYAALALLVWQVQRAFEQAQNSIETFIWQYTGVWSTFLVQGSLAVLSQILIYFFWPIYLYFALKFIYGRLHIRQSDDGKARRSTSLRRTTTSPGGQVR